MSLPHGRCFVREIVQRALMLGLFIAASAFSQSGPAFELRDGDRVTFIGDTLMEREQAYGFLEERMTAQFPERHVTFRNLGWSADTPKGSSRASFDFDKPGKGFDVLKSQIVLVRPTVVIIGYGMASSFDGVEKVRDFEKDLNDLASAIKDASTSGPVRFIFIGPVRHENARGTQGVPFCDPKEVQEHNRSLKAYSDAVREVAASHGAPFISLFNMRERGKALTDNGIHLSAYGYSKAAEEMAVTLGWKSRPKVRDSELLRAAIEKKNELCFDRLRPQNETYLFGFRKHEQGQNAKEIPMFDSLIREQEQRIHELCLGKPRGKRSSRAENATRTAKGESDDFASEKPVFDIAPGFEVSLYAESPLLAKPTQMNFDAKGRLWISSSEVYPQIQPGQKANDKILVLEDKNGDGYAEKSTVFADGLLIPTSVVPGDGGAYVGQGTELLHFTDTHGKGRADRKEIVLSGFGTEDTHHMIHTLRWGPDGQLYFNQSIYIHTHIETPHGVRHLNSGGVWRMRPQSEQLSVFVRGFCNPWGHAIDPFGQSFETDGAGNQGISYCLPGATYFTYASMRREMPSISPGNYPKFCGLELIHSPQFPPDWQGAAITCDFRAHRVVRFDIDEKGAGYAAHEVADLLRSTNVTFRPIDVKLGPDGALYIADWSNPIIQHGEVDFRDPRRDHEHGRIWRVTAKGRPIVKSRDLTKLSNRELLDLLPTGIDSRLSQNQANADIVPMNSFVQQQARRVLTERGKICIKDLDRWTKTETSDFALLQALWMYQSLDVIKPELLDRVFHAKDGRIRAASIRVASAWVDKLSNPMSLLAEAVNDEHPRVRLEAVRALSDLASAKAAALALGSLDKPMDSFLDYAVWLTINDLEKPWTAAVKSGEWSPQGHEKQLEFALKAIDPAQATAVLSQVLKGRTIPRDGGPWIELIGTSGDPKLLRKLLAQALEGDFDSNAAERAFKALNTAATDRNMRPSGKLEDIRPLVAGAAAGTDAAAANEREQIFRVAGNWKVSACTGDLLAAARSNGLSNPEKEAAIDAIGKIGGTNAIEGLATLSEAADYAVRREAVTKLAALDLERASGPAVAVLTNSPSEKESEATWRGLLAVKNSGPALAHALPKNGLPQMVAKAGLKIAREGGRSEPDLVWALTRGAGLDAESQTLSDAEMKQLATTALNQGNPARGERVFRRADLGCITCHSIGGVGGKVGPDLTSIGASAQPDYLVESLLYPNRKIKEGYHAVSVETTDGLEYTGVLVSENSDEIVLRDATGKENIVPKKNVENRRTGGSLMPSGLVDNLSASERLDLFRFLSELGKPGAYDASRGTVARSWRLCVQTLDTVQFGDDKVLNGDLNDQPWTRANSLVDGELLKEAVDSAVKEVHSRGTMGIYAAARFETAKPRVIALEFDGPKSYSAWLDGKPVVSSALSHLSVSAGSHTFVAKIDLKNVPESLKLESKDVTFLNN